MILDILRSRIKRQAAWGKMGQVEFRAPRLTGGRHIETSTKKPYDFIGQD